MINITEEQLKEIVTQAHMAGQHNQTGCDPSYFEAETHWQKRVKNLGLFSVSQRSELFFAVLKWAKQADLGYPDEMLLKDFEQFTAKNCG